MAENLWKPEIIKEKGCSGQQIYSQAARPVIHQLNENQLLEIKKHSEGESYSFNYQEFKVVGPTIVIGQNSDTDQSIFDLLENKRSSTLVTGSGGMGNCTFAKLLIQHFQSSKALHFFDKLLVFSVKRLFQAENFQMIEKYFEPISQQVLANSKELKHLVMFHIDGKDCVDKLTDSWVRRLMERKLLPESTILVICRPYHVSYVESLMKFDSHYTMKGFTEEGRNKFLQDPKVLSTLRKHDLLDMCRIPLVSAMLMDMASVQKFELLTKTRVMYKLISALVFRHFDPKEKNIVGSINRVRLESLPDSLEAIFEATCLLAMEHLKSGHKCTDRDDSQQFLSTFGLKLSTVSLTDVFSLGLVDISLHSQHAYEFADSVVMHFLAAFYLYKQPALNQLYILYKNVHALFSNGFILWLQFFFGLVGENYTTQTIQYNPTKLMINTVVDVVVSGLDLNRESEHRFNVIKCIHELQEKSLFRKLAIKHPAMLGFSLSVDEFDVSLELIESVINKSACEGWTISTSTANKDLATRLKHRVGHLSERLDLSNGDEINLVPNRTSAERKKMYRDSDSSPKQILSSGEKTEKLNQYCCRAVREILQRVFPIYSPVKIKGDASNISYVSFLTCSCFKEAFLENAKLFPLQPIHFLPGPKKDFSKIPRANLTPTDSHNLHKHDGESMEVVIMLKPLIQKVEGIVPITNEQFTLVLSHDLSLEFSDSIGADSELVAVERCFEEYDVTGPHTEQILPVLPIVQKTIHGRSQTAYPRPFLPPAQTPSVDPVLAVVHTPSTGDGVVQAKSPRLVTGPQEASHLTTKQPLAEGGVLLTKSPGPIHKVPQSTTEHLQAPLTDSQTHIAHGSNRSRLSQAQAGVGTSVQASQLVYVQPLAEQAASEARVHPATSRRQTALTPGTVLFSSLPDKIPPDQIQSLPQQRSLIRKGGNGMIFSETIGETVLAVKKTSYRSKEYAIITKIRHKNIIPLLAYVWGEEHQENKRRYYVYHYLPKLSGDLARLVTDKEELSLCEFHKMHQFSGFKAIGVAVGNVKYVLSQVLQGLQYLHKLHIAHRDLKASNILIKFFCGCATPIECGCGVKYQVVLCDYDAAIELDSNDHIATTPPSRHHTGASSQFEIMPVGTNGFRSPESSIHTVANDSKAFSPPLTTKTDIYSFGIFAMRLMISTSTPYSQRSMAMLLLHYHQLKGGCEGRISDKLSPHQRLDPDTARHLAGRRWFDYLRR